MTDKDSGGGGGGSERSGGVEGGGGGVGTASISEQERDWAQTALADFNRGQFATCQQLLTRLEAARPHDTKVLHNRAVVEYYKSDMRKTDQFKKNMNAVCAQAHINIEDLDSLEDVENCVIYYNQAVVLYHLKQYSSALKIMNKVFTFIEPMEESLAHRVCLLLIELHLCTQQPEKALALIAYIENQFVSTENAGSKMMAAAAASDKEKEPPPHPPPPPAFVALDAATDAFRLKLLQCRARCFLATCALTACKRELKTIMAAENSPASSLAAIFLKAHLHYQRGNFTKAIATLSSVPLDSSIQVFKETGESPSVAYYNDMGCLHHYLAKPNLANFYLSKAVEENKAAIASFARADASESLSGRPLHTVGGNRAPQLMYNFGVSLLHAGKPLLAFDCLTEAVQVYHMNPRLWLRLAECCIMCQRPDNSVDFDFQTKRKQLIQGVVGAGPHRKIILNPLVFSNSHYSYEAQSFAIPVASLEFASLCLRNAQLLLPASDERPLATPPSPPCDPRHIAHLRVSILAASAFVALGLGDPVLALEHANALLAVSTCSPVHKFLGHVYAGEALILLDRIPEAIDHLNPELCPDITDSWYKPLRAWYPQSTDTARSVLQYNLAVALAISGEYDKAGDLLKQVWLLRSKNNVPIHVIALAMYVELLLGHADVARSIVKQNCMQTQR